jgi:hypothetical protein
MHAVITKGADNEAVLAIKKAKHPIAMALTAPQAGRAQGCLLMQSHAGVLGLAREPWAPNWAPKKRSHNAPA